MRNIYFIRTLIRREIKDILSDWRVVLIIVVLTLFLPVLVRTATVFAIRFIDIPGLPDKLLPFTLLLVGFVPASFSLIPALETFVGERERNTLEALLSMPINDRELYLAKCFAGFTTPFLASMMAMTTFALIIRLTTERIIAEAMTPLVFLAIAVLVAIKAAAMVSAAVVVSARTTTIRTANLLASFIIIPVSLLVQLEAFLIVGEPPRLWAVGLIGSVLLLAALALLWWGMHSFSGEEVLAREHRFPLRLPLFSSRSPAPATQTPSAPTGRPARPMVTIVYREVHDTLSDWRMLLAILTLALFAPLLLLGASIYALGVVDSPSNIAQLVPFGLLLSGFIPASFSLITALESFVGEKERGTLESLFSTPLSNWELYTGKLLASLTTPLFSGLLAMMLFAVGLLTVAPSLLAQQVTPSILVSMAALVIINSMTMVAGAVIVSTHTGSIRAANLLASFIVLPMAVLMQLIGLYIIAARWDVLGVIGLGNLAISALLINSGLHSFNREEVLSREHGWFSPRAVAQTFVAFFRQYGPVTQPACSRQLPFSLVRFYRHELPQILRDLRAPLLVVLGGCMASILFGVFHDRDHTTGLMHLIMPVNIGEIRPVALSRAVFYIVHNSRVIFVTGLVSALTFGATSFLVPLFAFAGVAHGATTALIAGKPGGALGFILAYALPHGIFELPAAILAATVGLRMGLAVAATPPGITVGRHLLWSLALFLKLYLFVIIPLLVIAGLIEGLVTPQVSALIYG